MSAFPLIHTGMAAVATVVAMAAGPTVRRSPTGCDATSPRAKTFLANANATFTQLDSMQRVRLGWHEAPRSVTLVTRDVMCDSIVRAHNKFVDGRYAAYRVTNVVVVRAGNSFLLELPPARVPAQQMIFVYDSTLRFKTVY
jgi:hypothetical protein